MTISLFSYNLWEMTTVEQLARFNHINNAIWSKLGNETIKDFTVDWDELTEYQRELYVAGIEVLIDLYRTQLSSLRGLWRFYYRCKG